MDSLVLQDPVSYVPLPSAPPVDSSDRRSQSEVMNPTLAKPVLGDTVVTVNPVPLTIRFVSAHTVSPTVTANRQWLCYCSFIIIVFIFAVGISYYILFSKHKN